MTETSGAMGFTEAHETFGTDNCRFVEIDARIEFCVIEGAEDLIPVQANQDDAGYDLKSRVDVELFPGERNTIPTGICLGLPSGWEAQIRPRSGLAAKMGLTILNTPGTIDAGYRGEIGVILYNTGQEPYEIRRGDRIAQMVFKRIPNVELVQVTELGATNRGSGGFGSTGL